MSRKPMLGDVHAHIPLQREFVDGLVDWHSHCTCLHVGRLFNETGQMEDWWTQQSVDNFIAMQKCYVDEYSEFNLFGIYVSNNSLHLKRNIHIK